MYDKASQMVLTREGGRDIAEILQQRDEKTRQLPDPAEDARTMETQRYCLQLCHVAHVATAAKGKLGRREMNSPMGLKRRYLA